MAEIEILVYLLFLAIHDVRTHTVTNKSLLFFLPIILQKCILQIRTGSLAAVIPMLLGSAAGFAILLSAAMITNGGIGGGDIKLAAVLGLATGLRGMLVLLCVSSVVAVAFSYLYRLIKKKSIVHLPFVPFVLAGYIVSLAESIIL